MKITAISLELGQTRVFISLMSPKITEKRKKRKGSESERKIGSRELHVVTGVKRKLIINIKNWYSCVTTRSHATCVKWVIPEKKSTNDKIFLPPPGFPGLPASQTHPPAPSRPLPPPPAPSRHLPPGFLTHRPPSCHPGSQRLVSCSHLSHITRLLRLLYFLPLSYIFFLFSSKLCFTYSYKSLQQA